MHATSPTTSPSASGARLVGPDDRPLPLRGTALHVEAGAGLARVRLVQTFRNPYGEPLRVRYLLPLPADGAVTGFAFVLDGVRTEGRVETRSRARADFERALLEGRSASLLEEERSSLFTQDIGNIPPGAEIRVEVAVDQPLAWLPEGAWSWRFPTVVGPRYMGAPGQVEDAGKVEVPVAADPTQVDARATFELRVTDPRTGAPRSPSHPIRVDENGRVALADEAGVLLDRDLVVEWPVAEAAPGVELEVGRLPEGHPRAEAAYGICTVVPPAAPGSSLPRDLIVLVDVSGSMHGEPLEQAKRVLLALVDRLEPQDRLELIAFANRPERWKRAPVRMDERGRAAAATWIRGLRSRGATEMRDGIEAAVAPLREGAVRQVVVATDGYVGFEAEIVGYLRERRPRSSRVHALGVGSAVNRSLTGPLARAGGGRELVVAPGEDAERHAGRLLAVLDRPLVREIVLGGTALLEPASRTLPDLHAGEPARIPIRLRPEGGTIEIRGETAEGPWSAGVDVPPRAPGEGPSAPAVAFARERIEDLEMTRAAAGADVEGLDAEVEALGVDFRLATRLTSWVAIRDEPTVDPTRPTVSREMPHRLAAGLSAEGVGLAAASSPLGSMATYGRSRRAFAPAAMSLTDDAELQSMLDPQTLSDEPDALFDERLAGEGPPGPLGGGGPASKAGAPAPRSRGRGIGRTRGARPPEHPSTIGRPVPPRRLIGRARLVEAGEVVIDVEVGSTPFELERPDRVMVALEDGTRLEVEVVAAASTDTTLLAAGQSFRLVLRTTEVPARIELYGAVVDVVGI